MKVMNLLKKNAVPIFVVVVAVTLVLYMNYKPEGFHTSINTTVSNNTTRSNTTRRRNNTN